jgi:hypothetical protein
MEPLSKLDIDRMLQLIPCVPADHYGRCLVDLVRRLVSVALAAGAIEKDSEAVDAYIRERLGHTRSETRAAELIERVRENDPDFDDWLFSGDHEEMILVADSALRSGGEELLERYLNYRDNYPEYGVIHPSDYSGPKEEDEESEWARLVADFADLVRDWRDGFLQGLITAVSRDPSRAGIT